MSDCCECINCKSVVVATDEEHDEIYEESYCDLYQTWLEAIDESKVCEDFEEEGENK